MVFTVNINTQLIIFLLSVLVRLFTYISSVWWKYCLPVCYFPSLPICFQRCHVGSLKLAMEGVFREFTPQISASISTQVSSLPEQWLLNISQHTAERADQAWQLNVLVTRSRHSWQFNYSEEGFMLRGFIVRKGRYSILEILFFFF